MRWIIPHFYDVTWLIFETPLRFTVTNLIVNATLNNYYEHDIPFLHILNMLKQIFIESKQFIC